MHSNHVEDRSLFFFYCCVLFSSLRRDRISTHMCFKGASKWRICSIRHTQGTNWYYRPYIVSDARRTMWPECVKPRTKRTQPQKTQSWIAATMLMRRFEGGGARAIELGQMATLFGVAARVGMSHHAINTNRWWISIYTYIWIKHIPIEAAHLYSRRQNIYIYF